MLKVKILSIGKTKEKWLEDALQEYLKRLSPVLSIEFLLFKTNEQLESQVEKEMNVICLDPQGKMTTSEEFASIFLSSLEKGGSKIAFVIGGPEGLPSSLKQKPSLGLSKMTFTHQICRLILVEQIYRAIEMKKGSKYHK